DLFEEIKLEIFKYLNQDERIICGYVSSEWRYILSLLPILQKTIAIGKEKDSKDRMKLCLCNINACHIATPFNTIDLCVLQRNQTDDGQKAIKLSDIPDTIEHIHFGHNIDKMITFDKINFPRLTCISTIDAHLDDHYLNGITNLLAAQKLQLQNLSVCEVPRSVCEQIIGMSNLKQLYVFDFHSDFEDFYNERNLEVMDAHPQLQHFNMFSFFRNNRTICPTEGINKLVEFGSSARPFDRKFLIDVFKVHLSRVFEFAKDFIQGLHLRIHDVGERRLHTKLNYLKDLRLSYHGSVFTEDTLRLSLEHHLNLAPNVRNIHFRFYSDKIFDGEQWMKLLLGTITTFAQKNSRWPILFELSAFGDPSSICVPYFNENLKVVLKSLRKDK
ncbi:hypothetical protein Bhyg_15799, partial [Pseudolycoriella hygida]